MKNFALVAFLALAFCVLIAEVKSSEHLLDELNPAISEIGEKASKGLKDAKEKFSELEKTAENVAHALGPEGDKLLGAVKNFGKSNLKKGLDWIKAKFAHKAPAPAARR